MEIIPDGFILLDQTKNGERREVPINSALILTLQDLPNGTKKMPRRIDIPWLFYNPITENPCKNVKRPFASACRRAKIQDFNFDDLRNTFASHLVMAGVDLMTVKELLGHKSLNMTLRYAHLAPDHKVKAVHMLDSKLNPAEI